MRHAVLLLLALVMLGSNVPAQAKPSDKSAGSWVVMLRDGTKPDAVAKAVGASPTRRFTEAFSGFVAKLSASQLRRLERDRRVVSLTENEVIARQDPMDTTAVRSEGADSSRVQPASRGTGSNPVPAGHPAQLIPFGVARIGALKSPTAAIDKKADPMDVDIAILDSGVSPHLDLNLAGGADCADGSGFKDRTGHGTFVAGITAAKDNAFGVVGVAPGARVWSVRVVNADGVITDGNFLCAFDWLRKHAGVIDVANMSFGAEGVDTGNCGVKQKSKAKKSKRDVIDPIHHALCRAVDAGVTLVGSAGNDGSGSGKFLPAAYPEVIAVSAMTDTAGRPGGRGPESHCPTTPGLRDDTFAPFSDFGKVVDIAAPGVCIQSTTPEGLFPLPYATGSGTSFSAPFVAGAAALLRARHPDWTPAKVRAELLRTAEPGPIPGDPDRFKEGIVKVRGY